jgi:ribosomal protein S12 methylthiotransferase
VLPYLDMPLQHINDRCLRRMQRRVNRAQTEELLAKLRAGIPGLALRTTFIVGFPGETDAEFEELVEFVRATKFERAGVFPYSFEPGTPATRLDEHLPEDVKLERQRRLMESQQEVAFAWSAAQVGRELEVILDGPDTRRRRDTASAAATPTPRTSTAWCGSRGRTSTPATWCA